jgi:hypothetical protein
MEVADIDIMSLVTSASLFIMVLAIKLYKMKIKTHSGCCGDKFEVDTENNGSNTSPLDSALNNL